MKRILKIAPTVLAALSLTATAWAGGSTCEGKSDGAAKQTMAESHCAPGASAEAKAMCTIGSKSAVYSFAVPGVECNACVKTVQRAVMTQKGVHCAHVDLESHTAYVVAEKKLNERAVAKAITESGFRCTFKSQGSKVRAELMKAMASGDHGLTCSRKEKDKV